MKSAGFDFLNCDILISENRDNHYDLRVLNDSDPSNKNRDFLLLSQQPHQVTEKEF